jgi:hypothetical protein
VTDQTSAPQRLSVCEQRRERGDIVLIDQGVVVYVGVVDQAVRILTVV